MTKIYVYFVLALALQICVAKPKAAATPQALDKHALEELVTQAKDITESVSKTIKDALPDTAQVTKVLKDQSQEFADNVKNIVTQIQTNLDKNKGEFDDAIKLVSVKLSQSVSSLQTAAGPEATAQAKELKEKLDENFKSVAQEIDNLVKTVQPNVQAAGEQISSLTKNVLNEFVESARKLQSKVNEAANTPKTTEKH